MKRKLWIFGGVFLSLFTLTSCGMGSGKADDVKKTTEPVPPIAKKVPKEMEKHGHVRQDPYYWIKERENPEVISYLEAENTYTDAMMKHTQTLEETLFQEIKGRIKQDDNSVPYLQNGYFYYTRYETGKEYPFYCRKKGSLDGPEEIMLDVNQMAEGHGYFNVGGRSVSSSQNVLAYAVDTVGRRIYTTHFKNLETGEIYPDAIENVTGNMAWANDNKTLFYSKKDKQTLRSFQIYKHVLGTDPKDDVLVYEEKDDTYRCFTMKTKSEQYILIGSFQTLSTEYRFLDADNPEGAFQVVIPRERDHEYFMDHFEDKFYFRTNDGAKNFKLVEAPVGPTTRGKWNEVLPHREDVLLEDFEIFKQYLVLEERKGGLNQIRVRPWNGDGEYYLEFADPAYSAGLTANREFDTPVLRYFYSSMTTPDSTYDFNMDSKQKTLLKREEILGDFDPANYTSERLHAKARDGVEVPISLVYRKGVKRDGNNPLLLYGYGSYGASMDASFRSSRLSLLDRGFVYAIAHIRGGQELGTAWYEDGKLLKKKNTFTDFIDSGSFLVDQKYTNNSKMFAYGGSAGGLLVGAVINMAPEVFHGAVAAVPFVDVITTMLDDTIPLTTFEYDEWGNPNDKTYYDYMLSYSPYDQVEAKNYPHLLVTTGLHDSQVQYWEPAKWVAKLRAMKTDNNKLLMKTNMEAGHGGASGRFKRFRELAFRYAFLLDLAGIQK